MRGWSECALAIIAGGGLGLLAVAACAPNTVPRSPGAPPALNTPVVVRCDTYDYEGQSYGMCFPPGAPAFVVSSPGVPTLPAAVQTAILLTSTPHPLATSAPAPR